MPGLFIPGWGAHASLYGAALPEDWAVLEPPSFRATQGSLERYVAWLARQLADRRTPFVLGGHSFGAALAVLAAAEIEAPVERLVLVAPAGLPLAKPIRSSALDFARQVGSGLYPAGEAARSVAAALAAPRSALRLARAVHALDLRPQLERLRLRGVRSTVVAAATDSLTTPSHCRRIARLAGSEYRELSVSGGHVWFLGAAALHRRLLTA